LVADIDGDGQIGIKDLELFSEYWLQNNMLSWELNLQPSERKTITLSIGLQPGANVQLLPAWLRIYDSVNAKNLDFKSNQPAADVNQY
jgi:hypothetical protein